MDKFRDFTVKTIFNEEGKEFNNVPEFTFEECDVSYFNNYAFGTLDIDTLNISFSEIKLKVYEVAHQCEDESAVVKAGFSKEGYRLEIVNKEGNIVSFNLEESDSFEYNWLDDFLDNMENYKEVNSDNVCVIFCSSKHGFWEHSIVVNYGQVNGHDYKEYHFEGRCSYAVSVVETGCEEDWIKRGYTFVDGVGYRFETQEGVVYNLTINEDPENGIDLSFLNEEIDG